MKIAQVMSRTRTFAVGRVFWLVAGVTDLRRGVDGLCALVQTALSEDPFAGQIFIFRGRRGDKVKILWQFYKRLHRGYFFWPQDRSGTRDDLQTVGCDGSDDLCVEN